MAAGETGPPTEGGHCAGRMAVAHPRTAMVDGRCPVCGEGFWQPPDLLERVAYLKLLDVRIDSDGCLTVDAEKLMHDDLDIRYWVLSPEADGQWTHGPSGTTASLGASLWAITSTYEVSPSGGPCADGGT